MLRMRQGLLAATAALARDLNASFTTFTTCTYDQTFVTAKHPPFYTLAMPADYVQHVCNPICTVYVPYNDCIGPQTNCCYIELLLLRYNDIHSKTVVTKENGCNSARNGTYHCEISSTSFSWLCFMSLHTQVASKRPTALHRSVLEQSQKTEFLTCCRPVQTYCHLQRALRAQNRLVPVDVTTILVE